MSDELKGRVPESVIFDKVAETTDDIRIEIDFNCKTMKHIFKFLDGDGDLLFHPENYEDVYYKSIVLRRILLMNVGRLEQALDQASGGKFSQYSGPE